MKCFWFAQTDARSPSTRYRGIYLLEELRHRHGIRPFFCFPSYKPRNILRFLRSYLHAWFHASDRDVVVIQKVVSRRIYARLLLLLVRRTRALTIYDLDDAEHLRYSEIFLNRFVEQCDRVVVGSDALGQHVARRNPRWRLLTSPIIAHNIRKADRESVFTIGWIGFYDDHRKSFEALLFPALEALGFPFRLVILGVRRNEDAASLRRFAWKVPGAEIEIPREVDWLAESEIYERIRRFDVGLAPLLDNEHTRSKSAFKAKQYLSCGVPVLGSPIGENRKFIRNGVNGFLCDSPEEYRTALSRIHSMPEAEYRSLSRGAISSCRAFSMANVADDFLSMAKDRLPDRVERDPALIDLLQP